ncbi:MAG TPA: UvrD-helicase domain-containing protein, partial [Planctomycetota bacterium]|nr:UvrD-helicase domain-containing protein [Planctomycetota bacterium]
PAPPPAIGDRRQDTALAATVLLPAPGPGEHDPEELQASVDGMLDDVAAAFEYDLFWPDFVAQELDAKSTRSQATWVTLLEHFDFEGLARIARRAALEPSFRGLHIDWSRDELLAASKAALEALDADQVKDRSKLKYGDVARTCADLLREVLAHANDETLEVGLATRLGSFLSASATPPKPGKTDYPTEAEQEEAKLRLAQGRIALEAWSALPPRAIAEALEAFVARVGAAFEARLTRLGRLTFSECLVRCAALLRRSPAVRMNLRDRYSMILVDEFQDTDPLQYDMLFFLAQEGQARASDDPLRVTLRRGLLCIVGDPKQSIYRFRGADMRAYVTAVKAILDQGGRELDLSVNFRSEPEILDFVNLAVTPLFVANGYQAPRQDLASPKERRGAGEVVLLHVDCASKDDGRQREAAELVRFVLEDRRAHERSWSSYALLFRATTHIEDYARALRDAAVPILVEGSKRFYARSEVERFLALVRLVVAPWDEAAMLAYLRGPLAAVPDRELFTVAEASRADHDD